MIIGCGGAFLILILAPLLGLGDGITFVLIVVAMFACHILMMGHHGKKAGHQDHQH